MSACATGKPFASQRGVDRPEPAVVLPAPGGQQIRSGGARACLAATVPSAALGVDAAYPWHGEFMARLHAVVIDCHVPDAELDRLTAPRAT